VIATNEEWMIACDTAAVADRTANAVTETV
jgi:hypothetical protein